MKTLKLTVIALLLSATTTIAQSKNSKMADKDMSDSWKVSNLKTKVVVNDENETYVVKQLEITEEYTPVMLDPKDKKKLNQDIIYMPTEVNKRIRLDYDKDRFYDKEVKFNYLKSDDLNLNFTLTKRGIKVKTDTDKISINSIEDTTGIMHTIVNNRIQKEGTYTLELSNGEKIKVTVTDYNIMK